MGAIKYADLSNDRIKDYVFDWNRMLAFDGNTAPYLMYAHARDPVDPAQGAGVGRLRRVTGAAAASRRPRSARWRWSCWASAGGRREGRRDAAAPPHLPQLYEVATAFTGFYEKCPVLKAEEPARSSRLALSRADRPGPGRGLALLGIQRARADVSGQGLAHPDA